MFVCDVFGAKKPMYWRGQARRELEPARLIIELQKARQADFLLQRLIEVLDVAGLLGKMLEALDSSSALERVHNVARLFDLYDELLLNGVVGAVPGGRRKQK